MHDILKRVTEGSSEKYLMPFFHLKEGENRESMYKKIKMLKDTGVNSFLGSVRSSEYMGWGFWKDMDQMVDICKELEMSFWIQDEQMFPTGSANGWIKTRAPHLRKLLVDHVGIDAAGPRKGTSFNIKGWMDPNNFNTILDLLCTQADYGEQSNGDKPGRNMQRFMVDVPPNKLLAVVAYPKDGDTGAVTGEGIDLTDCVKDGWLFWDVPEGIWSIQIFFRTHRCARNRDYINVIDRDSVRLLIDALYEPMYDRYKDIFGTVFKGFFSDETEYGNIAGFNNGWYDNSGIGHVHGPLPWSDQLEAQWKDRFKEDWAKNMAALWENCGEENNARVCFSYMDMLTKLFSENFSVQIGDWCREHGCLYTGHLVEDAGNHARLGAGVGHYFRCIYGEDIAGIDVVENQILPGMDFHAYNWGHGGKSGAEFTYVLAKLGASAALIDPKKKGRTLCENFAAYDRVHGVQDLKYVTDNMMVRGVNIFMPNYHVSGRDITDQAPADFKVYPKMNAYTTRVCTLHQGGKHAAPVAVLYHAEAEWSGAYRPMHEVIREMSKHQIDCDILPSDVWTDPGKYPVCSDADGLHVNGCTYKALVVPYMQFISADLAQAFLNLTIPVIFTDSMPQGVIYGMNGILTQMHSEVVSLDKLVERLDEFRDLRTDCDCQSLRYYHYQREGLDSYMLFAESPFEGVDARVFFEDTRDCVLYDALENKFICPVIEKNDKETCIKICLKPQETIFVLFGDVSDADACVPKVIQEKKIIEGTWQVEVCSVRNTADIQKVTLDSLKNLATPDCYQEFNGTLTYKIHFDARNAAAQINLGEVYQTANVLLNGKDLGVKFSAPYVFEVKDALENAENELIIEVAAPPRDFSSFTATFPPLGLLGPVTIEYLE